MDSTQLRITAAEVLLIAGGNPFAEIGPHATTYMVSIIPCFPHKSCGHPGRIHWESNNPSPRTIVILSEA